MEQQCLQEDTIRMQIKQEIQKKDTSSVSGKAKYEQEEVSVTMSDFYNCLDIEEYTGPLPSSVEEQTNSALSAVGEFHCQKCREGTSEERDVRCATDFGRDGQVSGIDSFCGESEYNNEDSIDTVDGEEIDSLGSSATSHVGANFLLLLTAISLACDTASPFPTDHSMAETLMHENSTIFFENTFTSSEVDVNLKPLPVPFVPELCKEILSEADDEFDSKDAHARNRGERQSNHDTIA